MKRTRLIASFLLALILLLTMVAPAMAKPVDDGWREYHNSEWIVDTSGNLWSIICQDCYNPNSFDYIDLLCYTPGFGSILVDMSVSLTGSYEYDFSINMRKGTATLVNPYVNLTATASGNESDYNSTGSHKERSWQTSYYGPGSLKGNITIGSTVYTFNYTSTSDFLFLTDYHYITK